jgi:outer membrane protein assembly factor BamB
MRRKIVLASVFAMAVLSTCLACGGRQAQAQWPQWGGPDRNFTVSDAKGLADSWPEGGPPRLWERELGGGCSAIVVDDGMLFTMYRNGGEEFSVALDARTGRTIWEQGHPSPGNPNPEDDRTCTGPNSTPLVCDERLYTVGTDAVIHCFNKRNGKILWKHDMVSELGGRIFNWGYAPSPIAFQSLVITPVGRRRPELEGDRVRRPVGKLEPREQSLVAFDQVSGDVVWRSQDFVLAHSSPILVNFHGQTQLVLLLHEGIMGVNPEDGELLWHRSFPNGGFAMTPVWAGDDVLITAGYHRCRATKLVWEDGTTVPQELWSSPKIRFPHNNPVRVGDYLFGSSGSSHRSAVMLGVDLGTGKRLWAERGFKLATCVYGDGKLIILDEDGNLALATPTPEGLTVHSRCRVTRPISWTVPTLVETTLYLRDCQRIMALNLGRTGPVDGEREPVAGS